MCRSAETLFSNFQKGYQLLRAEYNLLSHGWIEDLRTVNASHAFGASNVSGASDVPITLHPRILVDTPPSDSVNKSQVSVTEPKERSQKKRGRDEPTESEESESPSPRKKKKKKKKNPSGFFSLVFSFSYKKISLVSFL